MLRIWFVDPEGKIVHCTELNTIPRVGEEVRFTGVELPLYEVVSVRHTIDVAPDRFERNFHHVYVHINPIPFH